MKTFGSIRFTIAPGRPRLVSIRPTRTRGRRMANTTRTAGASTAAAAGLRQSSGILPPIRERHSAAGTGGGPIEGLIIDNGHVESHFLHGAGDRDPVLQLGGSGAEGVRRNRD